MALLTDEDIAFYQASLIVCKSKCLDDLDLDKLIDGIRQLTRDLEASEWIREKYRKLTTVSNKEIKRAGEAHAIYAAAMGEKIDMQFKALCQLKRDLEAARADLGKANLIVRDLDGTVRQLTHDLAEAKAEIERQFLDFLKTHDELVHERDDAKAENEQLTEALRYTRTELLKFIDFNREHTPERIHELYKRLTEALEDR